MRTASGLSTLNKDQIAERGARLARRDDREYREYLREEQRSQSGCPAREVALDQRGKVTWLLAIGLALCCGACASTGATPRPFPTPADRRTPAGSPEGTISGSAAFDGYALVGTALQLRGVPYKNGGGDLSGFDCSGLTQYVFGRHGVSLPRAVQDQYNAGAPVKRDQLAPGDLIFFTTTAPGASHVGIAVGGGDQFVHAPSSTGVVRVERLSASYWAARFVGARRVIPEGIRN